MPERARAESLKDDLELANRCLVNTIIYGGFIPTAHGIPEEMLDEIRIARQRTLDLIRTLDAHLYRIKVLTPPEATSE